MFGGAYSERKEQPSEGHQQVYTNSTTSTSQSAHNSCSCFWLAKYPSRSEASHYSMFPIPWHKFLPHVHQEIDWLLRTFQSLFMELVKTTGINSNPADFISRSIRCMESLQVHGKSNLLYKFAFCITEKCPETDKPILLMDRVPFGLIEYQPEFFACTNIMQVL